MEVVKKENGFNRLPLRALDKPLKRFRGRWQRVSPG